MNLNEESTRQRSLSGKIFTTVLVFTLAVIVVFSLVLTAFYYFSYEYEAEQRLATEARDAAAYLNTHNITQDIAVLDEQFDGLKRYTFVDADGKVLYDSATGSDLGSHADRPEIQEALKTGEGSIIRYSETLRTDTIYAAVLLNDGNIIRLSETRESLFSFTADLLLPEVVILIVAALLVLVLSQVLTRRIMKPIDALDFTHPLENRIYREMQPLLQRIDVQQNQLRAQNEELARAESMRRDFSANVSHEMKTPLQVISGYAELMQNGMIDPHDVRKFAGLIYDESQAMRSLINDVLILSKLDESAVSDEALTWVDVLVVAQRVVDRLAPVAKGRSVTLSISGESAVISGSETLIETMLYNLVDNAVRYNHEHGRVCLDIRIKPADRPEILTYAKDGNMVEIRVTDTGPGIPPFMQEKIFERFYRMEKSRSKETGGTGLGLAIVKHAVRYHHGSVEVESEEGSGATFVLRMPVM